MNVRLGALWVASITLACCASPAPPPPRTPGTRVLPTPAPLVAPPEASAQWSKANQILESRCVVCHGCYDAPCQLQLGSFDGIERGATKLQVYEATRLLASEPSRLFIDAQGIDAWRKREFHPVLPEGGQRDPQASLLVRMLDLKREHPLPVGGDLPGGFELGLDRKQVCASPDEFGEFRSEHPGWGMPYALPGLSASEHATLVDWVAAGTPHTPPPECSRDVLAAVDRWEEFLNDATSKGKLSARYLYEHLFLASLYFEGVDDHTFFRLVRSRSAPGRDIEEIPTRRPYDDPGHGRFFYRLRRQHTAPLAKTHMPYALSDARLKRWTELFRDAKYEIKSLPSYDPEQASNPFHTFRALPVHSRYRFMLEEAQFTMMGFIKGPVCRGQIALDVIEDRFWISFVHPESPIVEAEGAFLSTVSDHLDLPAESGSNAALVNWLLYARHQKKYLQAKSKFLQGLATKTKVTLDLIWDGDRRNPNAALTVLRHFDSATVTQGFVGGPPKTAWVVGYALLERIHYLLVAGFDVFGNLGHQLNTRLYMDFLRMEAEHNFLLLLPRQRRTAMVEKWYRDIRGGVKDQVYGKVARFDQQTSIPYQTKEPEQELYTMLKQHLEPVLETRYELGRIRDKELRTAIDRLTCFAGIEASYMPETSFVEVAENDGRRSYFTITRDSGHSNVARVFGEDDRRIPKEDHLTITHGFLGVYPNALFRVGRADIDTFVEGVMKLNGSSAYAALRDRFGVKRTDAEFWQVTDRMTQAYRDLAPVEAGLFDLNRLGAN